MEYPIQLNMGNRSVLLVGAGRIALRKCKELIDAGAKIIVVAPRGQEQFSLWEQEEKITWLHREYQESDLEKKEFVFVAVDEEQVTRRIVKEALSRNLWVNSSDQRYPGNFTIPAKVRQGDLLLTVSTFGKSPGVARQIREEWQKEYGSIWQEYLLLIGNLRKELLSQKNSKEREAFWKQVLTGELLEWVREGRMKELEAKIRNAANRFGN